MVISFGNSEGSPFNEQDNLQGIIVKSKLVNFSNEDMGFVVPAYLL